LIVAVECAVSSHNTSMKTHVWRFKLAGNDNVSLYTPLIEPSLIPSKSCLCLVYTPSDVYEFRAFIIIIITTEFLVHPLH